MLKSRQNALRPSKIRSVDDHRPLRVVVIGAGISGILACIRLAQRIPNLDLCIYEKNADIGGTWHENVYPGCACDIPANTYQASFEPNKEWSSFYAPAAEIHQYWKRVVEKYGCMEHIKLQQQVTSAAWNERSSKWQLGKPKVHNVDRDIKYEDRCDILVQATGSLNNWKWPKIPGLHDFKGKVMHSATWDTQYDYTNQRIAVIGNGSSGIQIVPGILPKVAHIDHYMRNRTWIAPGFARGELDRRGIDAENYSFTAEEIETFKNDSEAYQKFRKDTEFLLQSDHPFTITGTPKQVGSIPFFIDNMTRRLAKKPELLDQILPDFPVACRRLTPGPGYLEALTDPKVDLIKTEIVQVNETGILTADGVHRQVDMIACATGFDTTYVPRFPITGRGGLSLSDRWRESPETYISVATDGFPNHFMIFGPNSALGAGNLILLFEKQVEYLTECILKIQRDNIRTMTARPHAVQQFSRYCREYFKGTVYNSKCRSWYRGGKEQGDIMALWPGSSLHAMRVFSNPRWEDFDYDYLNNNPMGWFGDGWTANERNNTINVDYLDDDQIDFPTPSPRMVEGK
ncbi:uncharacterized protein N7483_004307 [Penicillium malachiteum]|uniref:uncharacterized protein n=1 Tax=Penicillium malachiteum TaxID=1324776 RepID=UPI002549983C|nr:uncharacterized protein N7483_004307 [Penicillium malachiteum]KAJ5729799.1 hypothetical protein N7483_004307 [Penicillium malachiteum]